MSYIIYTRGSGGVRCSGTGDDKDENFRSRNGTMLQVQNFLKTKFIRKFKNEIKKDLACHRNGRIAHITSGKKMNFSL